MKPLPTDPMALHNRFVDAFCRDLLSPEFRRDGATPQADAVVEIARQQRDADPTHLKAA